MLMKNSTLIKGLLAACLAFCANFSVSAQEEGENPAETTVVYQMVDQVTSGNSYVIGIMTDGGWHCAQPPFGWGNPIYGRLMCQGKFQLNDDMQVLPVGEYQLTPFTITKDDKGYLLQSSDGSYLAVEKPMGGSSDDKKDTKDDGKDDGKGEGQELRFILDNQFSEDYYWDIAYSDDLGGFTLKSKAADATLGIYGEMMTSEDENGQVTVTYDYRIVAYQTLPDDMVGPIYFFEGMEVPTGIADVNNDVNAAKVVYNLNGMVVGNTTDGLKPGVYVVKQGKSVKKVVVD